jgi:hypothetical protein
VLPNQSPQRDRKETMAWAEHIELATADAGAYTDSCTGANAIATTRPMSRRARALERICAALGSARCVLLEERTREVAVALLDCLEGAQLDLEETSARYVADPRVWDALEAVAVAANGSGIAAVRLPEDTECWAALQPGVVEGLARLPRLATLDVSGAWEGMDLSSLRGLRKLVLSTPSMFPVRKISVGTGVHIEAGSAGYSATSFEFVGRRGPCATASLAVAERVYAA